MMDAVCAFVDLATAGVAHARDVGLSVRDRRAALMHTWGEFKGAAPVLGAHGERLLNQFGTGLGFLATVRKDGGPRVHPVCPVTTERGLYVFVGAHSPKYRDLRRDPRYALHAFPPEPPPDGVTDGDEEFYVTGEATWMNDDPALRQRIVDASGGRLGTHDFEELFEFRISTALHTIWHNWAQPDTWPEHTTWRLPRAAG
jgi:hypothetical protein